MKKLAIVATVAMSLSALLSASTTEAPKPAEKPCTSNSCSKQSAPVAQATPVQVVAQAAPVASVSTMTADQQTFCNKLNQKCQQMFKAMDNDARQMCMDAAKTKEPNQACEDVSKKK